jgi:uncharacterized protein (DUF952 family)
MIFHITTLKEWYRGLSEDAYTTPSLASDGFIHCSTLHQTADTANMFFKGQNGLVLLCIDEGKLRSQCKYEDPTGAGRHDPRAGNLFPHVYGPINLTAVIMVVDFPADENGVFALPMAITSEFRLD